LRSSGPDGRVGENVKVGLILPLFSGDADRTLAFAARAEALGYDGVFAFDHLFPPGAPSERPSLEAFATLAAIAASTRTVAVGTLVTRAAIRPAGLVAKLAVSIDDISGGRMILGIGTGDPIDLPEHETYGLPYLDKEARRVHLVETVRAVKALFTGDTWPGGERVPAVSGPLLPPPVRPGGPPVWIGGFADAVVRIAAREAEGWNGWGMAIPKFTRKIALLRSTAADARREVVATWAGIVVVGRDDEEVAEMLDLRRERGFAETNVWAGSVKSLIEWFESLEAAGASWAILVPAGPADRVELIAERVLPNLRSRL
jgi:alkanesulfonate monooxygenase SsuD/methylene tetrahydromethanopterin reductase-like flavin-dependent oxidoreductase (luciferase family)